MQPMTLRRRFAICAIIAVIVIQIAVPLFQWVLRSDQPARFGWQMYALAIPIPTIRLHYTDGSTQDTPLSESVASMRPDVPFARFLTPHYCERIPDLLAVEYRTPTSSEVRSCSHS